MFVDKSPRRYYEFPVHAHNFWEITINLVGSGTATIDGRDYPFQEGTIFCTAPGVAHGKVSRHGFIDGSLMLRKFVPFDNSNVYHFEDDATGAARHLFHMMFEVVMKDGPNARGIVLALANALYQMLIAWNLTGDRNPAVERFQKTILDNFSNPDFDLSECMRASGYSSSYFRKLFKLSTGRSPLSYLNQLRIESAKNQIQRYFGSRTMKDIALDSGFSDPYYFSRVFRQHAGISPTRYGDDLSNAKVKKVSYEPSPE